MESMQLTWFGRSGKKLGTLGEPGDYTNPALSPDERRLAVSLRDARTMTRDLWVFDVTQGTGRRLTFDPADDTNPTWSPDGKWIAFTSNRGGAREVYRKLANGSGDDERLLPSKGGPAHVEGWSPDGRFVLYNHWPGGKPADLFVLPLSSGGAPTPIPFLVTDFVEDMGQFSPNGRWIAYRSVGFGRDGVYVKSVSAEGRTGGGEWQVSSARGLEPRWRGDGRELFYVSGSTLMAVEVKTDGASFDPGYRGPCSRCRCLRNRGGTASSSRGTASASWSTRRWNKPAGRSTCS
jgi:Tol biopolymer transport system component